MTDYDLDELDATEEFDELLEVLTDACYLGETASVGQITFYKSEFDRCWYVIHDETLVDCIDASHFRSISHLVKYASDVEQSMQRREADAQTDGARRYSQ